jgi:hypothetical protein
MAGAFTALSIGTKKTNDTKRLIECLAWFYANRFETLRVLYVKIDELLAHNKKECQYCCTSASVMSPELYELFGKYGLNVGDTASIMLHYSKFNGPYVKIRIPFWCDDRLVIVSDNIGEFLKNTLYSRIGPSGDYAVCVLQDIDHDQTICLRKKNKDKR